MDKPWGRPDSAREFGVETPPGARIGEVWLTADRGRLACLVKGGSRDGLSLAELSRLWGPALLGTRLGRPHRPWPLLLKYLRAAGHLSVQVHPDDDLAIKLDEAGPGKTEAWYVLAAEPGANLILGLESGVAPGDLAAALTSGRVENVLNKVPARAGEVHYIPAGMLHSIGPGVTLFEIQPNSDLTYRFFDWGRVDDQGQSRTLHLDRALAALDPRPVPSQLFTGLAFDRDGVRVTVLAAGRYFYLERLEIREPWVARGDARRFETLTVLSGRGRLTSPTATFQELTLIPGPTTVIPALLEEFLVEPESELVLLRAFIPDLAREVIEPLRDRGFSRDEIITLAGPWRPNDLTAP